MNAVGWWVTHDPAGGPLPFTLRCQLGRRIILTSHASERHAVSMAPAIARALVQAANT